jgi:hypothetical protein
MTIREKQKAISEHILNKAAKLNHKEYKIIHNDNLYNSNKPDIKEIKRILNKYGYSDLSSYLYDADMF